MGGGGGGARQKGTFLTSEGELGEYWSNKNFVKSERF